MFAVRVEVLTVIHLMLSVLPGADDVHSSSDSGSFRGILRLFGGFPHQLEIKSFEPPYIFLFYFSFGM